MPADRQAVGASVEPKGLRVRYKGQNQTTQGGVGVNVGTGDSQVVQDTAHVLQIVHGALHRRADISHDNYRHVPVDADSLVEVVVVYFAVVLAFDHDVAHIQHA